MEGPARVLARRGARGCRRQHGSRPVGRGQWAARPVRSTQAGQGRGRGRGRRSGRPACGRHSRRGRAVLARHLGAEGGRPDRTVAWCVAGSAWASRPARAGGPGAAHGRRACGRSYAWHGGLGEVPGGALENRGGRGKHRGGGRVGEDQGRRPGGRRPNPSWIPCWRE